MKKVLIKIEGMTCAGCSSGLEKYLNKQHGIIKAEVNLVMSNASVEYDEKILDLSKINEYVKEAGFKSLGIDKFELEKKDLKTEKLSLWITIFLGLSVMYISMANMLKLPEILYFSKIQSPKMYALILFIFTTIILVLSLKTIINGIKKLIHKIPNMDTLISIGVITAYLYSIYSSLQVAFIDTIYVDKIYFESAVMVLVFTKIGRYIEVKNRIKTKEAITKLMTITPSKAVVLVDSEERKVSIDLIKKGDIVICRPGERIAVDGVITHGTSHIDESFLTGESVPKDKKVGDRVIAGSINIDGYIEYRAEKIGKDSTISEIVKMVTQAVNTKPEISKLADKISYYFVPSIILIAIISFITWLILGNGLAFALNIFVSVLVVACPCALGLATPIAIVVGVSSGARKGLLIKNSKVLEATNKIDTVVFDKTGTLTEGKLSIANINKYGNLSENGILELVGSIEKKSEHPIAKAIVDRCEKLSIKLGNVREFEILPGLGIVARYRSQNILVGNKELMLNNNISINEEEINRLYESGNIVVHLSIDSEHVASIELKDRIKNCSKDCIDKLKEKNIEVIMLTGDNKKTASIIAEELAIDNVIAEVLPKDKANTIKQLKDSGKKVMMVGDGINDAPSLVTADIGVSIEGASDIAIDSSDVVIVDSNLSKINLLLTLSKKTIRIIKQNLFWAFIYNTVMIPVACGIFSKFNILINPMYSALAMTTSSIIVVLNSLRLKRIK